MIAFDTNYLVRHIVQDDARQCRTVATTLKNEVESDSPILILDMVLMETCWVLENVYEFDRDALGEVLESLLEDSAFCFENSQRLRSVLKQFCNGKADFADYMISSKAHAEGFELKSFDKQLLKELRRG